MTTLKTSFCAVVAAGLLTSAASAISLQDLTHGYDVFVKEDATLNGVHIHGSIATGDDLILQGNMSEFASRPLLSDHAILTNDVISQGADGRVFNGQSIQTGAVVSGQGISGNDLSSGSGKTLYMNGNGAINLGVTSVDFSSAFSALESFSASLASLAATVGFTEIQSGVIGNANALNVVNVTWDQIASLSEINFGGLVSVGKLIINVDISGDLSRAFAQNHNGGDNLADNVLWNFVGADASFYLGDRTFKGSVLALGDSVSHANGNFLGQVVAENFSKTYGQVHVHRFDEDFKVNVPDTGSTLVLALLAVPAFFVIRRRFN